MTRLEETAQGRLTGMIQDNASHSGFAMETDAVPESETGAAEMPRYISIRWKLLLIYFICVLIPIGLVSAYFYNGLLHRVEQDQRAVLLQSVKRSAESIARDISEAVALSDKMYTDSPLYESLDRAYPDPDDFYKMYESYLKIAWQNILPFNSNIRAFTIYCDNPTVLNGKIVEFIDDTVKNSPWMKLLWQNGENIQLMNYYGANDRPGGPRRQFALLRKLDFNRSYTSYMKLLKIDYDPDMLFQVLSKEDTRDGILYVLDEKNNVIASSSLDVEARIRFADETLPELSRNHFRLEQDITANSGWKVVGIFDADFFSRAFVESRNQIFIVVTLVIAFSIVLIVLMTGSLSRRLSMLARQVQKVEKGELELIGDHSKGSDELGYLITVMNQMISRIHQLVEDVSQARVRQTRIELEKKQAELNALQSQVDPHFMFNVLETIRMKSFLKNEQETARMVKFMSKMFRKLLLWDDDLIKVSDEMEFIKEFLEIQRYRFDDELTFELEIDEAAESCLIPKMVLQTLVENACVHGIEASSSTGKVTIRVERVGDELYCLIRDNGVGLATGKLMQIRSLIANPDQPSGSVGIRNVVRRLMLYYGDDYRFDFRSEEDRYTEVLLTIPVRKVREN